MIQPRFPIYIPSYSRHDVGTTTKVLQDYGVPHYIVVEPQQRADYEQTRQPLATLIDLDMDYKARYETLGELVGEDDAVMSTGSGPARNFAWDHAKANGHPFYWCIDDNIFGFLRLHRNEKIPFADATPFEAMERFVLRYENIAMAGPQYYFFSPARTAAPPFHLNARIFSCNLIRTDLPQRWRGRYNEDLILSLDMLKAGWCTVLFRAFLQGKPATQSVKGGNTEAFYAQHGTLRKSQMAALAHPDRVVVRERYGRWHHMANFDGFPQQLVRKPNYQDPDPPNYRMKQTGGHPSFHPNGRGRKATA